MDAIDELVARSTDHPELRRFHEFHQAHPEVLDFLVEEIQLLIAKGFTAFSYASLWHYCRWKSQMQSDPGDTYKMNDHLTPFYGRAITILHPEFNGLAEFRAVGGATADMCFGTELEPIPHKRPKHYARRLQWVGGVPLERGWHPTVPHTITHVAARRPDLHAR